MVQVGNERTGHVTRAQSRERHRGMGIKDACEVLEESGVVHTTPAEKRVLAGRPSLSQERRSGHGFTLFGIRRMRFYYKTLRLQAGTRYR